MVSERLLSLELGAFWPSMGFGFDSFGSLRPLDAFPEVLDTGQYPATTVGHAPQPEVRCAHEKTDAVHGAGGEG